MKKINFINVIMGFLLYSCVAQNNIVTESTKPSILSTVKPIVTSSPSPQITPLTNINVQPSINNLSQVSPTSSVESGVSDGVKSIGSINGRVRDSDNQLLNGVDISLTLLDSDIENKFYSTNTQLDGIYIIRSILLEPKRYSEAEITLSKIGYKTITKKITVWNNLEANVNNTNKSNIFNFTLEKM